MPARCSSSRAGTARARGGSSTRRELEVDVPTGIHDGQQIRVRGEGHAGFRSAERGNAFVVVRVRPDPRFVRDGDDLHTALRLTMTDAALGTTANVASLTGDVELDVPPGTQPGEVRVLAGRGDAVAARLPARLALRAARRRGADVARRRAAQPACGQLDAKLGDEAYAPKPDEDEGFFGRLKSALR